MTSDLNRFLTAQQGRVYENALNELKNGRKCSHWMWFIFPQINGLGYSETAKYYAIKNNDEAERYLNILYWANAYCTALMRFWR